MSGMNKKTAPKNKAKAVGGLNATGAATNMHIPGEVAPEANVAPNGHCLTVADGEMARPNTGAPCADGRDDDRTE